MLTIEVAETAEVERWVLGFGEDAEVLAPESLRRRVARRLVAGALRYPAEKPVRAGDNDRKRQLTRGE